MAARQPDLPPKSRTGAFRQPVLAFLGSMRFAVALLCLLAAASLIGSLVPQNAEPAVYAAQFGWFWQKIFAWFSLFDVYNAPWFLAVLAFLSLSLAVCLYRQIPAVWRALRSFDTAVAPPHLPYFRCCETLTVQQARADLRRCGFRVRQTDGGETGVILAARQGVWQRLGYVLTHAAVLMICAGSLADSDLGWRWRVWAGQLRPDAVTVAARDFPENSRLNVGGHAFRGTVRLREGQSSNGVFVRADDGWLWQPLPFQAALERLSAERYRDGTPQSFAAELRIRDASSGGRPVSVRPNHPFAADGVTLHLLDFGDGGSPLKVAQWDLTADSAEPFWRETLSQSSSTRHLPAPLAAVYWDELAANNPALDASSGSRTNWHSVRQRETVRDLGARVYYRLQNADGSAYFFAGVEQPLTRDGARYFLGAARRSESEAWRWWFLPADRAGSLNTFMRWRQVLRNAAWRQKAARLAAQRLTAQTGHSPESVQAAVDTVLAHFAQGGAKAVADLARGLPENEAAAMRQRFDVLLAAGAEAALDTVLREHGQAPWTDTASKRRFVADALAADDDLRGYPAPVWLQLTQHRAVYAAVLQASRTPGRAWVYGGAGCLIAGMVLMLYVREQRVWLRGQNGCLYAAVYAHRTRRLPENLRRLQNEWTEGGSGSASR